MDAVKWRGGDVRETSSCRCGAARLVISVPRATFSWDASRPSDAQLRGSAPMAHRPDDRLMDVPLDVVICLRCDGGAVEQMQLGGH